MFRRKRNKLTSRAFPSHFENNREFCLQQHNFINKSVSKRIIRSFSCCVTLSETPQGARFYAWAMRAADNLTSYILHRKQVTLNICLLSHSNSQYSNPPHVCVPSPPLPSPGPHSSAALWRRFWEKHSFAKWYPLLHLVLKKKNV